MNTVTHRGSCHCGVVCFEVDTPVTPAVRCNCSLCRRKGILMTPPFPETSLRIVTGHDELSVYQFNTRVAKHFFCRHCGVATFNKTRKDPLYWRANIGCFEDTDPYALEPIQEELESDESVVIPCLGAIRDRSRRCGSPNTV